MPREAHFRIDPRLATVLGENYRSTEQALKELIDNAWDADAETVEITLPDPLTRESIVVRDDGYGMTEREVRQQYLSIADDRRSRKGKETLHKKRMVKGRKGIGKFAGLVTAEVMRLETRSRGTETVLVVNKSDLLSSQRDLEKIPLPLETRPCEPEDHGTTVSLFHLNQLLTFPDPDKLREILALEYGHVRDFRVFVNGSPVEIEDLPGESFIKEVSLPSVGNVRLRFTVSNKRQRLRQSGIVLRVDGKIVGKPSYFGLDNREDLPSVLLKTMYGEVQADGLVDDVTADWGAIIENSKAFGELTTWIQSKVEEGLKRVHKKEIDLVKARMQQEINRRIEQLPEYRREFARRQLERVIEKFYGDSEERIRTVVSVVLDALEKDEYWTVVQEIDSAKPRDIQALAEALESFGLVDVAFVARQARHRQEVLDVIEKLVANEDTEEKQVHKVLESNLWIIGSEYAFVSSNKTLARVIEGFADKQHVAGDGKKRPDLFLAHYMEDRHVLVEFKRPAHTLTRDDENQAEKYRDLLAAHFPNIEVLVLGRRRDSRIQQQYERADVRLMSYVELISNARRQIEWLLRDLNSEVLEGAKSGIK